MPHPLIIILLLFTTATDFSATNPPIVLEPQSTCQPLDFMQLQNKELQDAFFHQRDSILKVQYPDNDQEKEIFVDITRDMLTQFLRDIDTEALSKNGEFQNDYHFKIAPKEFSDLNQCEDMIYIRFFSEDCEFRMEIHNSFYADWCQEGMVVYHFTLQNGRLSSFWRNAAG
jgi:hypothetical protein